MKNFFLLLFLVLLFNHPLISEAATCSPGGTGNAAEMMARRQLSALRAIERSRGCKADDAKGGFFNACRDLAVRIGEIQKQIGSASNRACTTQAAKSVTKVRVERSKVANQNTAPKVPTYGGKGAMLFCVRLTDGYFFPAPHSQFQKADFRAETLARCRFICESENVDLYILNDPNEETTEMVSIQSGRRYLELPSAFGYHGEREFKKCNWAGYVDKISELRTASKRPKSLANVVMPLPGVKPSERHDDIDMSEPASFSPMGRRKVRVIGPAFMFDDDAKRSNVAGQGS